MESNGKHYYKFTWDCGYAGTDGYSIDEFDKPLTHDELDEICQQYVEDMCPSEGGYGEPDQQDLIDEGIMPDPDED